MILAAYDAAYLEGRKALAYKARNYAGGCRRCDGSGESSQTPFW